MILAPERWRAPSSTVAILAQGNNRRQCCYAGLFFFRLGSSASGDAIWFYATS